MFQSPNVAGIVETTAQLREQKMIANAPRDQFPVRFASLPPVKETSLVSLAPVDGGKVKRAAIDASSGTTQVWQESCENMRVPGTNLIGFVKTFSILVRNLNISVKSLNSGII